MVQNVTPPLTAEDPKMSTFRKNNTVTISRQGDVVLQIKDDSSSKLVSYRVSSAALRKASAYFDVLLDPNKFSEGIVTSMATMKLEDEYPDMSLVPTLALPLITISDVGQFPAGMSNKSILTHFFTILHDPYYQSLHVATPLVVALLAVVADRFDVVAPIAMFVKSNKRAMKGIVKSRDEVFRAKVAEEVVRQNILSGLLLHIDELVLHWSARLIMEGSSRWTNSDESMDPETEPQWWNLPNGVDDELMHRRACILETIGSLQDHFLQLYSSKTRQCKLGYDSSLQCDSFQLGEMVKFFVKRGTLDMQSRLLQSHDRPSFTGNINALLASLGECPEYQIDLNHKHCGLRSRFYPAIEFLKVHCARQGLCLTCWRTYKHASSWLENPSNKAWHFMPDMKVGSKMIPAAAQLPDSGCSNLHTPHRDLFTSQRRTWTRDSSA